MFSLIITIVSIALVVALVAATMYYGGDTLTEGRTRADASAFISGGQQIAGAIQLQKALNPDQATTEYDTVPELITAKRMTGAPEAKGNGWTITFDSAGNTITSTVTEQAVCDAINKQAGEATPDAVTAINGTYGCISADKTFTFKF